MRHDCVRETMLDLPGGCTVRNTCRVMSFYNLIIIYLLCFILSPYVYVFFCFIMVIHFAALCYFGKGAWTASSPIYTVNRAYLFFFLSNYFSIIIVRLTLLTDFFSIIMNLKVYFLTHYRTFNLFFYHYEKKKIVRLTLLTTAGSRRSSWVVGENIDVANC